MTLQLNEQSCEAGQLQMLLCFQDEKQREEFPITMRHPHDAKAEENLEWYFETYIDQPYTAESKVRRTVEQYIVDYGQELFRQLFADDRARQRFYDAINRDGFEGITFEIVGREKSTEFQAILWETLRDPDSADRPLVASGLRMVRRSTKKSLIKARVEEHPTLNLLIVTARPGGAHDVNYRTIQRPLIELLRKTPGLTINPVILRPGTYQSLKNHLDEQGSGFYHIIHFDVHGEVLEFSELQVKKRKGETTFSPSYSFGNAPQSFRILWGRDDLKEFEGKKAFLFFEALEKEGSEPVEAPVIAQLLRDKQIPVCILNACQSAKQEGETNETSLAKYLHESGVDVVMAMRYSVSVSAAGLLIERLYDRVFQQDPLDQALSLARIRLYDQRERLASLGYKIELEDWALPIVFQNQPVIFKFRRFTTAEKSARLAWQARAEPCPVLRYGFKGRDLDSLKIEKSLLAQQHLLLRGMVGVGKSTLLRYLAAWWTTTNFRGVASVAYLDFATLPNFSAFLKAVAHKILDQPDYKDWQGRPLDARAQELLDHLNGHAHGLIFDNIFAWGDERTSSFLQKLQGKSFAVYGSVNPEAYLEPFTFDKNIFFLEGLDKNAAYELAAEIVRKNTPYRWENLMKDHQYDLENLMELLAGFPSVMESVLPLLKTMSVPDLLEGFNQGTLPVEV